MSNPQTFFVLVGLSLFRRYLTSEYSEENLEFWILCERYKYEPANDLEEKADEIYRGYLAPQSLREVNCR